MSSSQVSIASPLNPASPIIYNGAGLTLLHNDNGNYSLLMAKSNSNSLNKKNVWIYLRKDKIYFLPVPAVLVNRFLSRK